MCDVAPVVASDGKGGGAAGGAGGAMDVEDLRLGNADVVAERRRPILRSAQVGLGDYRAARLEVLERADLIGMEPRLAPLRPVQRGALVGVPAHLAQALREGPVALARVHGLADRAPAAALRLGLVAVGTVRGPRTG